MESALPAHFVLGADSWSAFAERPPKRFAAAAKCSYIGPDSSATAVPPRARLRTVPEAEASVWVLRRHGESLCSRQRSEREIAEARAAAAEEAEYEATAAEEDVEETKRLLSEGLILANGAQAPPKRKRPSGTRPPGSRKVSTGDGGPEAEEKAAKKRAAEEAAAAKRAEKAAKQAEKEAREAEKAAEKEAKAKAKAAAKKGSNNAAPLEAGALVEVSLRLGEAYANWYVARLLEAVKGRWKVALQRRNAEGTWEPLLLEGRPSTTEWAKLDMLRPLPSPVEWSPSVDELCELLFEDGWWKVKVQTISGDTFTVNYAPANAVHTVPRERLRPMFTWDAEAQRFLPIKTGGRR